MRTRTLRWRAVAALCLVAVAPACSAAGPESTAPPSASSDGIGGSTEVDDSVRPIEPGSSDRRGIADVPDVEALLDELEETGDDTVPVAPDTTVPATNEVSGPSACRRVVAALSFPDPGRVAPPEHWPDLEEPTFEGEDGISMYYGDDLDELFTPEGAVDPDGLIATWTAAGYDSTAHLYDEDGPVPIDAMVSMFRDHAGAVEATRAQIADLCESAETAAPLADGTGIRMTSVHGPAKVVVVAGRYGIDLTAWPSGPADPDTFATLDRTLEELYASAARSGP